MCCVLKVLEGRSYRLQQPWVGVVNRSQADINRNVDMILARRKEREYFSSSPDYSHLASRMGSEYLAKLLSQVIYSEILTCVPLQNYLYSSKLTFQHTYIFPYKNFPLVKIFFKMQMQN